MPGYWTHVVFDLVLRVIEKSAVKYDENVWNKNK